MINLFDDDFIFELNNIKKKISEIQNSTQNKSCVYTCLIGEFDHFSDISQSMIDCDSFIITDNQKLYCNNTNSIIIVCYVTIGIETKNNNNNNNDYNSCKKSIYSIRKNL
jgi:hypothetical protein